MSQSKICWQASTVQDRLGMESCISDAEIFFKHIEKKLIGMCATYVEDSLHSGKDEYSKISNLTERKFQCKPREWEWDNIQFSGVQI